MSILTNILKIDFVSELFGDLQDMFWHHYWYLKNYPDPLTIIQFSKKKKNMSEETQNYCSIIFHYSNYSKVSCAAELCTFSFFHFVIFSEA